MVQTCIRTIVLRQSRIYGAIRRELKEHDLVLVVDNSDAMEEYWDEANYTLKDLCSLAGIYDGDGFDVCIVEGSEIQKSGLVRSQWQLCSPMWGIQGLTRYDPLQPVFMDMPLRHPFSTFKLSSALTFLLDGYKKSANQKKRPVKKINYIVLTSRCTQQDDLDLEAVISSTSQWIKEQGLAENQIGFQFVQIGEHDLTSNFLSHLDKGLTKQGHLDLVDTTQIVERDASTIVKVLLGAILRRVDEAGVGAVHRYPLLHRSGWKKYK